VVRPYILTRIENGDDLLGFWITPLSTIAAAFVAIAARQRQIVDIIRPADRLRKYVVNCEADELPSFIGVTVFATQLRSVAHDPPT
jgi:hypothetical protein